jgi:hypothetical protein
MFELLLQVINNTNKQDYGDIHLRLNYNYRTRMNIDFYSEDDLQLRFAD